MLLICYLLFLFISCSFLKKNFIIIIFLNFLFLLLFYLNLILFLFYFYSIFFNFYFIFFLFFFYFFIFFFYFSSLFFWTGFLHFWVRSSSIFGEVVFHFEWGPLPFLVWLFSCLKLVRWVLKKLGRKSGTDTKVTYGGMLRTA